VYRRVDERRRKTSPTDKAVFCEKLPNIGAPLEDSLETSSINSASTFSIAIPTPW
jgi:hypothetical protein